MRFIYSLFIFLFSVFMRIAALFNAKAKLWVEGRKNILTKIKSQFQNHNYKIIWFHCASLGEFEQGRPLIESLKKQQPEVKILLTFFSPSGYEIRKNYSGADWVFYLPLDTRSNAKEFVSIVNPAKAIFVKYEFWFHYLQELHAKNIPIYFVSVNVRANHYFLKPYGKWALKQLKNVTHFFVQNITSFDLLTNAGITQCTIAGDTRFDRVYTISQFAQNFPLVAKFPNDSKIIVAGSTWHEDEKLLSKLLLEFQSANSKPETRNLKLIVAPHEIDEPNLKQVEAIFSTSKIIRYSKASNTNLADYDVLLIDNIGMLSSLYQHATLCYIGGGFGKGIHNILEAAVFGKPILFGPNYQKFEEAKTLVSLGGAIVIEDFNSLQKAIQPLLNDENMYLQKCNISKSFVLENLGAVDKILKAIA